MVTLSLPPPFPTGAISNLPFFFSSYLYLPSLSFYVGDLTAYFTMETNGVGKEWRSLAPFYTLYLYLSADLTGHHTYLLSEFHPITTLWWP
jgi:hypothetical protein